MSPRKPEEFVHLVYARSLPIAAPGAPFDPLLEAGKRHNLSLACPAFDGRVFEAGDELSFWDALGPATAEEGYREGLDQRGGCLFPTIGGGLCLLSNALFEMAAQLGWTVHERHGHLMEGVAPEPGELWGLDARILYPYVDLRVSPVEGPVRMTVRVGGAGLLMGVYAIDPPKRVSVLESVDEGFALGDGGWLRENRIRRTTYWRATGAVAAREIVAENSRCLVTDEVRRAA